MSKLKNVSELIPPKSKEQVIEFHTAKLREYILFQEEAHKNNFMRQVILCSFCTCCGRRFSEHPELTPEIHHKNYNCRCLNGRVDCGRCYDKQPEVFNLCASKLCCVCNECHDKIYNAQIEKWYGKENE